MAAKATLIPACGCKQVISIDTDDLGFPTSGYQKRAFRVGTQISPTFTGGDFYLTSAQDIYQVRAFSCNFEETLEDGFIFREVVANGECSNCKGWKDKYDRLWQSVFGVDEEL